MRATREIILRQPNWGDADALGQRDLAYTELKRLAIRSDRRSTVGADGDTITQTINREYEIRDFSPVPEIGWQLEDVREKQIYQITSVTKPLRRVRRVTLVVEAVR